MQPSRSVRGVTIGAAAAAALAIVAVLIPSRASAAVAAQPPYRIAAPEGINCATSPFGLRLPLGLDQEPVLLRLVPTLGVSAFQHDGYPATAATELQFERTYVSVPPISSASRLAVTPLDFDGDGQQELAVASIQSSGVLAVSIIRRNRTSNALEQVGNWQWNGGGGGATLQEIAIANANLLPGSVNDEIVVAGRWSNNRLRVIALSHGTGGNIAQANNQGLAVSDQLLDSTPPAETFMRMAVGDMLAEGIDQVAVVTATSGWRIRLLRFALSGQSGSLSSAAWDFPRAGSTVHDTRLLVGDLGGSAAEEIVLIHQNNANQSVSSATVELHHFRTTRNQANVITGVTFFNGANAATIPANERRFAAAIGDLDRRPPLELVAAWQPADNNPQRNLRVRAYRAQFTVEGFADRIVELTGSNQIEASAPLANEGPPELELAIGDGNGDGIGEAYVALRDGIQTRLRMFALERPAVANAQPLANTFAVRGSFDYPTSVSSVTNQTALGVLDIDFDSVLADLDTTCRRVREPLIRTVVNLPPFWTRWQAGGSGFNAAIGRSASSGVGTETRYGTFTSHDLSGYVGLQVDAAPLGIGVKVAAKATTGSNFQRSRSELRGSEQTTEVTETQSQDRGRGLVVLEENVFDCYDYSVSQGGIESATSDRRACEVIRRNQNGDPNRMFIGSDLDTWDTATAAGTAGRPPAQWKPLRPDYANVALFRPVSSNFSALPTANLSDGLFDTNVNFTFISNQWFQVDLGAVRDISTIRVFRDASLRDNWRDFTVYVSAAPMVGSAEPSGPGVRVFPPDPVSGNGIDRWNIWTRGPAPDFAPTQGRYVRIQRTGPAAFSGVSELQVFVNDPPQPTDYPFHVCDPTANDGRFNARVVDRVANPPQLRTIHMRGDLSWTGVTTVDPNCAAANHPGVIARGIWEAFEMAGTAAASWDLFTGSTNVIGSAGSVEYSSRIGVEIDVEAGAVVQALAGGAYEFSSGVTEENSTTMYWGTGLNYSGGLAGFVDFPNGVSPGVCGYRPRPFSYVISDVSNIGYGHEYTVVDYMVRGGQSWTPPAQLPPNVCFPFVEAVFGSGFEG